MNLKFYILIYLISIANVLNAQEKNENTIIERSMQFVNEQEWIPTLLNANSNVLYNTVMFNGRIFSWSLRGDNQSAVFINGVNIATPLHNFRSADVYAGLQNTFHKDAVVVNGVVSEEGHAIESVVNYISNEVPVGNPKLNWSTGIANSIYSSSMSIKYVNGRDLKVYRKSIDLIFQQSEPGTVPIGYKRNIAFTFSVNKEYDRDRKFGFSILWNIGDQGKVATSVKEAFDLSKQRTYSPNWGWYHQQFYYPSTRQTNAPLFSFSYQKKWNEYSFLKISNLIVIGRQSESSLEWTKTADPRPDYYRYLPSYNNDSSLRNSLTTWYLQHPDLLQIQFDKLEKINKSSKDGRAYYIVNQENRDLLLVHGTILFSQMIKSHFNFQVGANYLVDQIHYSNMIKDLIGGNYYYNYNSWLNDDGSVVSFQNDIIHPDRKVKQGEAWGANYAMRVIEIYLWMQVKKEGPKVETLLSFGYGLKGLKRIGYNANGLYPNSSKGDFGYEYSPSMDIKAQVLYKISGRLYVRSILSSKWLSPNAQETFINPEINAIHIPYVTTRVQYASDLTFFYRSPAIKVSASAYLKKSFNEVEQKMFYHDAYASFVYGFVGNLERENSGYEATAEFDILQKIQVGWVSTLQSNYYASNPKYQLVSVNDLQLKESGLLHLNTMPASSSPGFANAINLLYLPTNNLKFGVAVVYAQERPVSIDLFRRSDVVKNKLDTYSWSLLSAPSYLPNQEIVNIFLSHSSQIKTKSYLLRSTTSLSVRNMLNALVPVFSYEQTRFDYNSFNANKYALKYLFDQGLTYSLRIQLQFQ